jgi:hypothetical protein
MYSCVPSGCVVFSRGQPPTLNVAPTTACRSNIGAKPMTPEDRARLAFYLYDEQSWTMARIGEALSVSEKAISRNLSNSDTRSELNPRAKTPSNPRAPAVRRQQQAPRTDRAEGG